LRKSHVIPNWMYFGLFDEKHKVAKAPLEDDSKIVFYPTGLYDSNILCESCDNVLLSNLENYGKSILYGDKGFIDFFKAENIRTTEGLKSAVVKGIEYNKFKLFLLSILFKMHLSKLDFFSEVDLGNKHAEKIRQKLLHADFIEEDEYEVAIISIDKLEDLITNMILNPKKIKQSLNTYYITLINGLYFMYNISPTNKQNLITKSSVRVDGTLLVPLLEGDTARLFYDSLSKTIVRKRIE